MEGLIECPERPGPRGFGLGCLQLVPGLRCRLRPRIARLARNLPLLPRAVKGVVQRLAEGFQGLLPSFPDHVDLGVVRDRLEGDVRHALVDEALADVAARRGLVRGPTGDFGLLHLALRAIGEEVSMGSGRP